MKPTLLKTLTAILFIAITATAQSVWDGTADTTWYTNNKTATTYTITTAKQLAGLAQLVNDGNSMYDKAIKLGADIILNDTTDWENWETNNVSLKQWTPIGDYNNYATFRGTFDGNDHVVIGVYIDNTSDYQGLFSFNGGIIENVGVVNSYINGGSYVGSLVGINGGNVSNSYSTGVVSGSSYVGGLVGYNSGVISNSYSIGEVDGNNNVGGLAGYNGGGSVMNSYSAGMVSGSASVGGLVGHNYYSPIINSYYNKENCRQSISDGGIGKTTREMQSEEFVTLLNAGASVLSMNAWIYIEGEYPKLSNVSAKAIDIASYFESGEGTETDPYIIKTKEHLEYLSVFVNIGKNFIGEYFKLGNDIMLNDTTNWQNWKTTAPDYSWMAIGYVYNFNLSSIIDNPFSGNFDGNGYVVSGVYINSTSSKQGLFGYLGDEGVIKNIGVMVSYVKGAVDVGSLVGDNRGLVSNSYSTGEVNGNDNVGGLVGNNRGSVSNSYSNCIVSSANNLGGLVGWGNRIVSNSYYDKETSELSRSYGGVGKTTKEMQSEEFVTLLNAGASILSMNAWIYIEGEYPKLSNVSAEAIDIASYFESGEGTETDPYIIKTKEHLEYLSVFVAKGKNFIGEYFKLGSNIILNDTTDWKSWETNNIGLEQWIAIGSDENPFGGTFDGDGYVISGVYIRTTSSYQGLFGFINGGTIKNLGIVASYIKGINFVGSLVGYNNGVVSNSYSAGYVVGVGYVGGLIGDNSNGVVNNSYSSSYVVGVGNNVGGLIGMNYYGTIKVNNSYYDIETSGQTDTDKGEGKTTKEMQSEEFVTLLNAGAYSLSMNAWIYSEEKYPKLSGAQASTTIDIASYFADGEGTEANPFIIEIKEQLEYLSLFVNMGENFTDEYFKLGNDIALNDTTGWQNWEITAPEYSWETIGTSNYPFSGTFDGNYHIISGVYINTTSSCQGLFGYIESGTIKNVGIIASYIKGTTNVGSLVGENNGMVSNSYSTGNVSGINYQVGGLVGLNSNTISNSYSTGKISGTGNVGGLVGSNNTNRGTVINSYYDKETSKQTDTGKGEGKTTEDMLLQNTYENWDFAGIWRIHSSINNGYPYFSNSVFTPVEEIEGVINLAEYSESIILSANVLPSNVTNKTIVWSVANGYESKAEINGNSITFKAIGEVKIKATIAKGISQTEDYEQGFTITVAPKPVTITGLSVANKEYDGNTTATITGTPLVDGIVGNDNVTVIGGAASFANKEAGTDKIVAFAGYSLGGTDAGNYTLAEQPASVTANITPKPVTITGISATSKEYDGTNTTAIIGNATINGAIGGDNVTVVNGVGAFANKNIGTGKIVAFAGFSLGGTDAGNYTLTAQPANVTANITAKPLSVTGATAANKVYNGETSATISGAMLGEGVIAGDIVLLANHTTGAFANKNAGTNKAVTTVMTLTGADAANYSIVQPELIGTITAKPVTITGLLANNKVYNGNTIATVSGNATINGAIQNDNVTVVNGAAAFGSKNIGTDKIVAFAGFTLGGTDASNYILSAQPANVTANISAKPITITGLTAEDKEYDGTTNATVTGTATVSEVIDGDNVIVVNGSAFFANKEVGTNKTVTFTGYSIVGADAGNYVLISQPASVKANITPIEGGNSSSSVSYSSSVIAPSSSSEVGSSSSVISSSSLVSSSSSVIIAPSSSSESEGSSSSVEGNSSSSSEGEDSSSSGEPKPSSSSSEGGTPIIPQIAKGKIHVQTIGNNIVLQNLPINSKVEVYNLKGNRIYLGNAGSISTLNVEVQTKGMYIVKSSFGNERQVMRVVVR